MVTASPGGYFGTGERAGGGVRRRGRCRPGPRRGAFFVRPRPVTGGVDTMTFFERALPAVIEKRSLLFDRNRGSVCIIVHGVGAWTLRFGDHAAPDALSAELSLEADLVLTWSQDVFESLVSGTFSSAEELVPVAMGDTALVEKVGNLLMPAAKGGVGAMLMRF